MEWGQFAGSVITGAASGALTGGVGGAFGGLGGVNAATNTFGAKVLNEAGRAFAHGVVQGTLGTAQGGSFKNGFASGALGSLGGSAFGAVGGKFAESRVGMTSFGALSGGVGAELSGGDFWRGAGTGATISLLNHLADHTEGSLAEKKAFKKRYSLDGISLADANTGVAFGTGAGAIELGNRLRSYRPIRLNNGSLLGKGTIARNLNSGGLMSGSRYLQAARGALYWTGTGAGIFGMGLSTYNYINGDNISGARYGADMFFGAVGFMGPPGLVISTTYSIVSSPAFIQSSRNFQRQLQENKTKYGSRLNFMERGLLCFGEGTNVTMGDGSLKAIESVMVGDTVLTYDFSKERAIKTEVLRIDAPMHSNLVQISFSNKVINCNTQDHPYFVKGKGWCSFNPEQSTERYDLTTSKLEIGDKCFVFKKGKLKEVKVISIKKIEGIAKTYNLTGLKDGNSYFANGVLVNNENKTQNKIIEEIIKKSKKDKD